MNSTTKGVLQRSLKLVIAGMPEAYSGSLPVETAAAAFADAMGAALAMATTLTAGGALGIAATLALGVALAGATTLALGATGNGLLVGAIGAELAALALAAAPAGEAADVATKARGRGRPLRASPARSANRRSW